MINNKICPIHPDRMGVTITQAHDNNFYLATIDGRTVQNEQEYLNIMYQKFTFPNWDSADIKPNYNAYLDWITDLSWLLDKGYKGFVLIIDYYNSFLEQEPVDDYYLENGMVIHKFKEYLKLEGFTDITNFWEYDIVRITQQNDVVDAIQDNEVVPDFSGEEVPHSFNIYLVDR